MPRSKRQLLLAGAFGVLLLGIALTLLRTVTGARRQVQANAADTLCALEALPEERQAAARAAAQAGTLRAALERDSCPKDALGPGLAQLAFVFERDCALDACFDVLLREPAAPQAVELVAAHAPQVVEALAARNCELGGARTARLLESAIGASAPAVSAAGRGRLLDTDQEALRTLLARRDGLAVRLLQSMLHGNLCPGDDRGQRREMAGVLLEAMGISVSEPVDLPEALERVACAPLLELLAPLGLAAPPRLAEAAKTLARCVLLPRSLRARAAGFVEPWRAVESIVLPARRFRTVDHKARRDLVLPVEALAPAVALLDEKGLLRGLAFLGGEDALVCGAPALRWTDLRGKVRLALDTSGLRLFDASGRERVWVGAQRAELRSPAGVVIARVEAGADHGVQLEDAEGHVRARGVWKSAGTQLKLLDGDLVLASLIVDTHGAQLQLGGAVIDTIPDKGLCVSVGTPASAKPHFTLEGPLGARAGLELESTELSLPVLDFEDGTEAERLDVNDTGTLRLLGAGVRAQHSGVVAGP